MKQRSAEQDPKKHYRSRNGLPQAFSRFLRPKYKSPYKTPAFSGYEPTPCQEAERAEGEAVRVALANLISLQRLGA